MRALWSVLRINVRIVIVHKNHNVRIVRNSISMRALWFFLLSILVDTMRFTQHGINSKTRVQQWPILRWVLQAHCHPKWRSDCWKCAAMHRSSLLGSTVSFSTRQWCVCCHRLLFRVLLPGHLCKPAGCTTWAFTRTPTPLCWNGKPTVFVSQLAWLSCSMSSTTSELLVWWFRWIIYWSIS